MVRRTIAVSLRLRHRSRLLFALLASVCPWASSQTPAPEGPRIIHESWTFKDGAPEAVEALAQTSDGYLWLGTPSGLFRFDGLRFELFRSPFGDQLPSTNVSALLASRVGGLWVGYRFGGFSFLKNGSVRNYLETTGTVGGFAQDRNGTVWAATSGGVWRFDGASWRQNPAGWNPQLRRVAQVGFDRDGTLWVLTDNTSVEFGRQLFYLTPDGKQFRTAGSNLFIQSFTWDADFTVLTTQSPRQPGSGIQLEGGLPAYPILKKNSEQIVDRTGGIWFLSLEPYVIRHPASESLAQSVSEASRSNSRVDDINPYRYARLVDREGRVWIGDPTGVNRFTYSALMQPDIPKTQGPHFTVAAGEAGAVWVNAGNGQGSSTLYRVVDGRAELHGSHAGLSGFAYRALDETLWFGGEGGLWHMVTGRMTRISLPPEMADRSDALTAITQDTPGGMWVSFGPAGLYRLKDGVWAKYGGRSDLPTSGVLIAFTDGHGRIWFGSTRNRLAVLDGDRVQTFGPNDGVQVGNVLAIYGRGPEIWIGGEFGLQQFDHGRFHSIHAVDMESLRGISGIAETAKRDLWLNGLGGVIHLDRMQIAEALRNVNYRVRGERFGRREGLPGLPSQLGRLPTAVESTDGRLWFTVNGGVVSIDPARASGKIPSPPVSIQAVSADDKSYRIDSPIRFPPHTSNIQISYAAVSLADPEGVHFRYKLRETDNDWHEAASTSVSYRNLPPGSYHFLVSASDTNGLWSDNVATAEFTVSPAFYQEAWFRAICAIGFLVLLWAAYEFRIRQLERQYRMATEASLNERTRIARELHDTLLQSVQGVMFSFQAVRNLLPDRADEAIRTLDQAIQEGDEAIAEGRDAIQGLRADPALASDLEYLLTTAAKELARSCDTESERPAFQVIVEGAKRSLSPALQDEVHRIAREILRNAFYHARATRIEAEIKYDSQFFRLRIRDDGKGIEPDILEQGAREGHWGLPGVRERAKKIGARLRLWSEQGAGTESELIVPARIAYATRRRRISLRLFRRKKV